MGQYRCRPRYQMRLIEVLSGAGVFLSNPCSELQSMIGRQDSGPGPPCPWQETMVRGTGTAGGRSRSPEGAAILRLIRGGGHACVGQGISQEAE